LPFAFCVLPLAGGCSRAPDEATPAPPATWSRQAFAPAGADAGSAEPIAPASADPAVLAELLGAAPRPAPLAGTGADGGTAVGTDTGVPEDAGVEPRPAEPPRRPTISIGKVTTVADMSDPAIERAARAQLYWGLVQRCRGRDGQILPPEAVHLSFQLDLDGHLLAPTILAIPRDDRFKDAAHCMRRELSNATFRPPVSALGRVHQVDTDVPSVD
jgi:hypothetical protein